MHRSTTSLLLLLSFCFAGAAGAQNVECKSLPRGQNTFPTYVPETRSAHFAVTVFGNVLSRPGVPIDEGENVVVHVVTNSLLAPLLKVRRSSPFRPVGTVNIVGGTTVQATDEVVKGLRDASATPCDYTVTLSDFAPGRGEVQIVSVTTDPTTKALNETALGTFDFAVQPLYYGAFSFGPARSTITNPSFGLVFNGTDSVLTRKTTGKYQTVYLLTYTAFIWGKRDLAKDWDRDARYEMSKLWRHVNPFVAAATSKVTDNAFVGVSIDLPNGIFLQWGEQFGHATVLDTVGGAKLGQPFRGASTAIPTISKSTIKPFFAFTIDVRAALQFLHTAASTAF